jgi:hypothetical protein
MPMLNIDLLLSPAKIRPAGDAFLGTDRRLKQGVKR